MIRRFRHKGLRLFYESDDKRWIGASQARWLRILLTSLEAASSPADLALPGYRLHQLKGERSGQWAISVSGNWRLVFIFEGEDVSDVDLVDYY